MGQTGSKYLTGMSVCSFALWSRTADPNEHFCPVCYKRVWMPPLAKFCEITFPVMDFAGSTERHCLRCELVLPKGTCSSGRFGCGVFQWDKIPAAYTVRRGELLCTVGGRGKPDYRCLWGGGHFVFFSTAIKLCHYSVFQVGVKELFRDIDIQL